MPLGGPPGIGLAGSFGGGMVSAPPLGPIIVPGAMVPPQLLQVLQVSHSPLWNSLPKPSLHLLQKPAPPQPQPVSQVLQVEQEAVNFGAQVLHVGANE
jgi:hypothetical protein